MLTFLAILAIAALICCVASLVSRFPLWVAVALLCVIELLRVFPMR